MWRNDPSLFGPAPDRDFSIEPEFRPSWQHEFGDRGRAGAAGARGGSGARLVGAESRRDSGQLGSGYTMRVHETALIAADYDARIEMDCIDQMDRLALLLRW